jgi:hypothetical protein
VKRYSIVLALLLAGCGGGGESTPTTTVTFNNAPAPTPTPTVTCTNPHNKDYPSAYDGWRPIPQARQTLPINYSRGISFKDYYPGWVYDNARGSIPNCTKDEYVKLMYTESLDKMKENGVTMTWLYNFGHWDDATAEKVVLSKQNYHIREDIVEFVVTEAKKRNINIYYAWQFSTTDQQRREVVSLGESVTPDKLNRILDAHHTQVLEIARFAQRTGVKGIAADWNAMHIGNLHDPVIKEIYITRFEKIIDDIRKVYGGEITWGQIGHVINDPRIIDKVDAIHLSLGGPILSKTANINLSTEIVRDAVIEQIYGFYKQYNCISPSVCDYAPPTRKIPVIFELSVQSRDKYWEEGWVEDGFCTEGITPAGTKTSCIQDTYIADFAVQAIGIEGILRAVIDQRDFEVKGVNFHSSYWHSDTLKPSYEGFPHISQSIRGKPAEKIVKFWFLGS